MCLNSWLSENSHWLKSQTCEKDEGYTKNSVHPRALKANARTFKACLSWEKYNVRIVSIANQCVLLQLEG